MRPERLEELLYQNMVIGEALLQKLLAHPLEVQERIVKSLQEKAKDAGLILQELMQIFKVSKH